MKHFKTQAIYIEKLVTDFHQRGKMNYKEHQKLSKRDEKINEWGPPKGRQKGGREGRRGEVVVVRPVRTYH